MFQERGVRPTEVTILKTKETNRSTTKQSRVYRTSNELFPCLRNHSHVDGSLWVGMAIAAPAWETQH